MYVRLKCMYVNNRFVVFVLDFTNALRNGHKVHIITFII